MTPDRDTLARDLLTLPALVGAPGEVVRGLVIVSPNGVRDPVDTGARGAWLVRYRGPSIPADLHAAGWRVDLDAPATAGPLVDLLDRAVPIGVQVASYPRAFGARMWRVTYYDGLADRTRSHEAPTLAEAAARALVEVARGR